MLDRFRASIERIYDIPTRIIDIKGFIDKNQTYTLLIIICFYLAARLITLLTTITAYGTISSGKFLSLIIFHSLIFLALCSFLLILRSGKKILVSALIVLVMLTTLIYNLIFPPDNQIIEFLSLFLQLIFIQMMLQFIFHDLKVNIITILASIVFISTWFDLKGGLELVLDDNLARFLLTIVIYGIIMIGFFLIGMTVEFNSLSRYISNLLYIDVQLGLSNDRQLLRDLMDISETNKQVKVIAFYMTNLLNINRMIGYKLTQLELGNKVTLIKKYLAGEIKFYKLEGPIFALITSLEGGDFENLIKTCQHRLEDPFIGGDNKVAIKVKTLGTIFPQDGAEPNDVFRNLQTLKYMNTKISHLTEGVHWFSENLYKVNQRTIRLEGDLPVAIRDHKIQVMIQPKIDIRQGEAFAGGEVLARWHHEEYGFISPQEFIPIIESEGLMDEFTDLILQYTEGIIMDYESLSDEGLSLAVNISATSLGSGFINERLLEDRQVTPADALYGLELELTENTLFDLSPTSKELLAKLKQNHYKISIDDFGTGFSNFEYLQQLEIDFLKIDKRFIDRLLENEKSELVVEAIIKMAHTLGVQVVAEGVEEKDQVDKLRGLGCDFIQGYYYSKPLWPNDFSEYVHLYKGTKEI